MHFLLYFACNKPFSKLCIGLYGALEPWTCLISISSCLNVGVKAGKAG